MGYLATGTIMGNRGPKKVKFFLGKKVNRGDLNQFTNGEIVAVIEWKAQLLLKSTMPLREKWTCATKRCSTIGSK